MKNIWNMHLKYDKKEKIIESFNTYKDAKEALDSRYLLWYHLGSDPKFKYTIKKAKTNDGNTNYCL
jgi:hypothetical protein